MTKKKAPEDLETRGRKTIMTPEKILLLELESMLWGQC